MHVNLQKEQLLSLKDAAKAIPSIDGKRPHISTIWRWCVKGLRGVRLEYLCVGKKICTTSEALSRFFDRLSNVEPLPSKRQSAPAPMRERTPQQRDRDVAQAEAELDGVGGNASGARMS